MRDDKVLGSTVRIDCTTHDSTGALVAPSSAFAASDFRIYKDGSAAEKTTTNGITVTSPFDSIVGKHLIEIDTSNSTGDSGFWAAGSEYRVELNSAKTISSIVQSGVVVGRFALVAAGVLRPTVDGRTIAVSATTGKVTAEAVELDPTARVKLDASQPDYAPLKLSDYTAPANSDVTLIKAKTDNLPSDPADQSLIIDATNAVMARLGAPAGASMSADVAAVKSDTASLLSRLTANAATAIQNLWHMITGTGASSKFTVAALENAPSATGVDELIALQEEILASVNAYIAGIAASASLSPGTIVGFPTTLTIGDSYTDDCNSAIHVFIRDDNDDPITSVGSHDFTDGDFAPECIITQNGNTGRVKCEVEYVTASPENYLKIQIPSKESRRATAGIATVQVLLKWDGAQKALSKQTVTWNGLI